MLSTGLHFTSEIHRSFRVSGCSRRNFADGLKETSNCYCHPGIAGGSPAYARFDPGRMRRTIGMRRS